MKVPVRERYNAKARGSTVGGSSHKNKRSLKQREADAFDSNAQSIEPGSEQDLLRKEAERKRRELLASSGQDGTAPISAKKRKRLDAYIASRLKKEERVKIMASLAQTSSEVDRTTLRSAATLGTGRAKTMEERIETANQKLDRGASKRRRRGDMNGAIMQVHEDDDDADLDHEPQDRTRDSDDEEATFSPPEDLDNEDGADGGPVGEVEEDPERRARILAAASLFDKPATTGAISASGSAIGSALAKGPDGQPVATKMRKRTKRTTTRAPGSGTSWGRLTAAQRLNQEAVDSDSSFDSSASDTDTDAMGPAPIASLSRKNNEKKQNIKAQAVDKGKAKATDLNPAAELVQGMSTLHSNEDDASSGSEELDTDEDEEAIFLEAMRLRGLATDAPATSEQDPDNDHRGRPELSEEDISDNRATNEHTSGDEDATDSDGKDEDERNDSDDDDNDNDVEETEEAAEYRSRRRGIGQTARSSGFKDWARAAVGLAPGAQPIGDSSQGGNETTSRDDEDTAYNLEPVGGFKVKISDTMPKDGLARGPLGRDDEGAPTTSPFALKHYAELREAVATNKEAEKIKRAVTHVEVQRSEDSTVARMRLPVVAEEDTIVRTIMENPVTVICGETGSGKTTQVPQFLYEAAFGHKTSLNPGMIGVTQPRRVAAVSMAQRVAKELSLSSNRVSHQIRYDATVSSDTAIKFMTDGVLLRELATDFLLTKYSAIMVDEAHERSINTDVLIGVLSRVVRLREKRWLEGETNARPLRLIIMSATLRVADFTDNKTLFALPPPVINIDARQHPVTVHFNRKTVQDYITESVKKASKIHARLPSGGILIFLTGQQEITSVCKKLEQRFGRRAIEQKKRDRERVANKFEYGKKGKRESKREAEDAAGSTEQIHINATIGDVEAEEIDLGANQDLAADVDDGAMADEDPDALDTDDEDEDDRHDDDMPDELKDDTDVPMHILPLYSLLPSDKQMRIFQEPPVDSRLVVVATNVAETSLTIPNIRYVIDCGRSKERKYDLLSGVQSYEVCWVSKASASQRAGRAGRTGPGHCYRLYSSAVYEDHLSQFSSPEILRTPVEGLVLSMKAMNIDNVANFPFPTPPDRLALKKAEQILTHLGALEAPSVASVALSETKKKMNHSQVTELGRTMTLFPVSPRYAKMLAQGQQHGCLPYIVAMVAALSIGDPFFREQLLEEEYGNRRAATTNGAQGEPLDDYDAAFGTMEGDDELGTELANVTNKELLERERRKARRSKYFATMRKFQALGAGLSDTFRLLSVVGAYEYEGGSSRFCDQNFVRPKAMEEIHKLRAQLCSLISSTFTHLGASLSDPKLNPPSETQLKVIRQLIAAAYIDQVAVRADLISNESVTSSSLINPDERTSEMLFKLKNAGGGDRMQSTRGVPYKAMGVPGFAFIHPTSSFYHTTPPSWLVFGEVQQSLGKFAKTGDQDEENSAQNTIWLKTLTKINPVWLSTLGRTLCTFSKPTPVVGGSASASLSASMQAMKAGQQDVGQTSRPVLVTPTYAVGSETDGLAGGLGWELPSVKATQKLVKGRWILEL